MGDRSISPQYRDLRTRALEYTIGKTNENRTSLELNGEHQLFVHADDVNVLGRNSQTVGENTEIFIKASKDNGIGHGSSTRGHGRVFH